MKKNIKVIYDSCKDLSLKDLDILVDILRSKYSSDLHTKYLVVEVFNYDGNISSTIQKETGLECFHKPSFNYGGIGTNIVLVPKDKNTTRLEKEIIEKYTNIF